MVGMTGGVTDRGAMRRAHDRRYDRKLARPPGMSVAGKSRHAEHVAGESAFSHKQKLLARPFHGNTGAGSALTVHDDLWTTAI